MLFNGKESGRFSVSLESEVSETKRTGFALKADSALCW